MLCQRCLRLEALVHEDINLTWLEISKLSGRSLMHSIKNIRPCSSLASTLEEADVEISI